MRKSPYNSPLYSLLLLFQPPNPTKLPSHPHAYKKRNLSGDGDFRNLWLVPCKAKTRGNPRALKIKWLLLTARYDDPIDPGSGFALMS